MNIALLTTSYPLGEGEMSGIFVKHLIDAMLHGINVTVVAPTPDYPVTETDAAWSASHGRHALKLFRYAPMKLQTLAHKPGGIPSALGSPFAWLLLPGFLASMALACVSAARHADVIHANWSVNGAVAAMTRRLHKKPVVVTLRGSDVNRSSGQGLYAWMLRVCIERSDAVVCNNRSMCDGLAVRFPPHGGKIKFIPNGIDERLIQMESKIRIDKAVVNIFAVGNLTQNKNVAAIIEAAARLEREGFAVCLCIVGDGPQRKALEYLSHSEGAQHIVKFIGKIRQDGIIGVLREADIFVLASFSEGRPNALVEAMAANVAVVASDIGAVRELVEDEVSGLLFSPGDTGQLTAQLRRLCLDAGLASRLATNGRRRIIDEGLSWSGSAAKYAEIYQSLTVV